MLYSSGINSAGTIQGGMPGRYALIWITTDKSNEGEGGNQLQTKFLLNCKSVRKLAKTKENELIKAALNSVCNPTQHLSLFILKVHWISLGGASAINNI